MAFIRHLRDIFGCRGASCSNDAKRNPYEEKLIHRVQVNIEGEDVLLAVREIRNQRAEVVGAQSVFQFRGESVPVVISSPRSTSFGIGIDIAMPKEVMDEFRQELDRLKDEGLVSASAKLSYNPDTKNAILFMRSDARINGNLQRWRGACDASMQTLVCNFVACMPYIMGVYGE